MTGITELPPVCPRLLAPRPAPREIPDLSWPGEGEATLLVTSVEEGLGVPPGTVKRIRVSEAVPWPYTKEGVGRYTVDGDWTIKRILGTVPVEPDGSAHFVVPADVGLYFQALDEDFIEVRRMRSLVSFQPGETRSCSGCHETRMQAPAAPATFLAGRRPPSRPEPPSWGGDRPVSFLRDVQPILDRHCTRCHGGMKPAGGVDLFAGFAGAPGPGSHNVAFDSLQRFVVRADHNGRFEVTQPYQLGSARSRLVEVLRKGHHDAVLDRREWIDLLTWVDSNALFLGRFVHVLEWGRWGYYPRAEDKTPGRGEAGERNPKRVGWCPGQTCVGAAARYYECPRSAVTTPSQSARLEESAAAAATVALAQFAGSSPHRLRSSFLASGACTSESIWTCRSR